MDDNKIEGSCFPLLLLPTLVVERVLLFVDVTTLKRLRLTCTWTKGIVDSSQNLRRLSVVLKDKEKLELVKASQLKWNSFRFSVSDRFPSDQDLTEWRQHYAHLTKVLSVERYSKTLPSNVLARVVSTLLMNCSCAESIDIEELDFTKISSESWPIIVQHLKHVRNLSIKRIVFISDETRHYFGELVRKSNNLVLLRLPRLLASQSLVSLSAIHNEEFQFHAKTLKDEYEQFVVEPVLQKISLIIRQNRTTTLKTLFCPEELVSREVFLKLAQTCSQALITLHISEPCIVPSHILCISAEEQDDVSISGCMGSIAGVSEILLEHPFDKLQRITLSRSNFLFKSNGPYPVPAFRRLESISLHFSTWSSLHRDNECVQRLSAFITCLQSSVRPSVKSAHITRFPQNELCSYPFANLVRPYLLRSFVNLTKLELDSVTYVPQDFVLIWENLPKLENVILKSCLGVDDRAIVGSNRFNSSPSMLLLNDLKYLSLDGTGMITFISYANVFSKMRLIKLHHIPRIDIPLCEFSCIALVYGPVWNHLEHFTSMGMGFSNSYEKHVFASRFQRASQSPKSDKAVEDTTKQTREVSKRGCLCC